VNGSTAEPMVPLGLHYSHSMTVLPRHTVPEMADSLPGFVDMPPVFATAMMIGFIEQTCIAALQPYLGAGQRTVGTHVDVSHVAATPAGMSVTAEIELIAVVGRSLRFRVRCFDEVGVIGAGTHNRAIIDLEKFLKRVHAKQEKLRS
jgi:fluoroacetyl-CoA thioesterase